MNISAKCLSFGALIWLGCALSGSAGAQTTTVSPASQGTMHTLPTMGQVFGLGVSKGNLNASVPGLWELAGSPGVSGGQLFPSRNICPIGYIRSKSAVTNISLVVCEVDLTLVSACIYRPGYYACGRGASECCPISMANTCFPGAYACSVGGGSVAGARSACCIGR
jgi:hypothetical protein